MKITSPGPMLGALDWKLQQFTITSGTSQEVAPLSGNRVAICFCPSFPPTPLIQGQFWLAPAGSAGEGIGFGVYHPGAFQMFTFSDYGPIITGPWNAYFAGSGGFGDGVLNVYTFSFDPTKISR